jgi:hypothetical protein
MPDENEWNEDLSVESYSVDSSVIRGDNHRGGDNRETEFSDYLLTENMRLQTLINLYRDENSRLQSDNAHLRLNINQYNSIIIVLSGYVRDMTLLCIQICLRFTSSATRPRDDDVDVDGDGDAHNDDYDYDGGTHNSRDDSH